MGCVPLVSGALSVNVTMGEPFLRGHNSLKRAVQQTPIRRRKVAGYPAAITMGAKKNRVSND